MLRTNRVLNYVWPPSVLGYCAAFSAYLAFFTSSIFTFLSSSCFLRSSLSSLSYLGTMTSCLSWLVFSTICYTFFSYFPWGRLNSSATVRPLNFCPFIPSIAFYASSFFAYSKKAKPLFRLFVLFKGMLIEIRSPNFEKWGFKCCSFRSKGKLRRITLPSLT